MKYKRYIPLLVPILVWLLSQSFSGEPEFFYSALALSVLIITLGVKYLFQKHQVFWLPFIAPPLLFFISFSAYAAIIVGSFWIQLTRLLTVWFLFSYLRGIYYFFSAAEEERQKWRTKIDNLLLSGGFLMAFSSTAFLFDLPAFLNWPLYYLLLSAILMMSLLLWQFRLLPKEGAIKSPWLLWLGVLVLTELVGIFSLLPLNFNILALFLAIFYYLVLVIIRLFENGALNRRAIKLPLIMAAIIILALLLTSRWL